MADITLSSPTSSPYGAGELQLQNKAPMDGTLRIVTDSANTASPLKLSTSLVQSTSTIKITTSDVAYIDAEDNSGNNRFTVSRASASQLVTVDFASVPTDLTTAVGAIRTATDGVNLANVMTFLENGKIGIGTSTPTTALEVAYNSSTLNGILINQLGATLDSSIGFANAGVIRSSLSMNINTGECRWTAASGGYFPTIYSSGIERFRIATSGNVGIGTTTPSYKLDIKDATNSQARFYGFQNGVANDDSGEIILGSNGSCQGILKYKAVGGQLIFQNTYANDGSQLNLRVINTATTVIDALTVIGSGNVGINQTAPTARLQVKGSGTTSATTSLLVQDSAGTAALTVLDNGSATVAGNLTVQSTQFTDSGQIFRTSGNIALQSSGGVGNNNSVMINLSPNSTLANTAILGCESTTKGFRPPIMTTVQKNAIATPTAGLMVYDTTLNKLCVYTTAWETITSV